MKRFAVFSCAHYYPEGGMRDFDESFDDKDDAIRRCLDSVPFEDGMFSGYSSHVFDIDEMSEVFKCWNHGNGKGRDEARI